MGRRSGHGGSAGAADGIDEAGPATFSSVVRERTAGLVFCPPLQLADRLAAQAQPFRGVLKLGENLAVEAVPANQDDVLGGGKEGDGVVERGARALLLEAFHDPLLGRGLREALWVTKRLRGGGPGGSSRA